LVVIEAEQMCLTMRGLKKPGSVTITSAIRGTLRKDALRKEAFALIKGK
jgi:GTP cyclohydrolase I